MSREPRPLLSRVADSIYWMARYIERAENVARFIGVNQHLQLDLPLEPAYQWEPIIETSGDTKAFKERYGDPTEQNVVQFLCFDAENPNSIYSCLRSARENARSVRETISSEMWEQINSMYLQVQLQCKAPQFEALPDVLRSIRLACHMFQGITDATMSHNEAWSFLRVGRMMERADKTSRILDVKYFILLPKAAHVGTPYDDLHWSAVLKSVSAFETYRKQHGRISPRDIVDFLVTDPVFPRAIRYCVYSALGSLRAITGSGNGQPRHESERLMTALEADLRATDVDRVLDSGLHEYLDLLQTRMNAVDDALLQDFFIWKPVDQQAQIQTGASH